MALTPLQNISSLVTDVTQTAATIPPGVVLSNGSVPLTSNWDAGNFVIQSQNSTTQFNVKAYGAVGNGVADDTTAITNAIAAATGSGGGIVFFPHSTSPYLVSTTLTITNTVGVRLVGESSGYPGASYANGTYKGSTLKWTGANSSKMISILTTGANQSTFNSVENLNLDGGSATGIIGVYADATGSGHNIGVKVDSVYGVRLNRVIQIGDYTNNGNNDGAIDPCILRRVYGTEPDNITTSCLVYVDSRNVSDLLITEFGFLAGRYGIFINRVGYMKCLTGSGGGVSGANLDIMDGVYLNGNHGVIDLDQIQFESCNSVLKIAANPQGLTVPINIRNTTLDSDTTGTNSTIQVGAASLINSTSNQYDRPITFTAGASIFNTIGDTFVNVGGVNPGQIAVGATGTLVQRLDGATGKFGVGLGNAVAASPIEADGVRASVNTPTVKAFDTTALAANTGGGIALGGVNTAGGATTEYAALVTHKDNATSGQTGAGLAVYVRQNGTGGWAAKGTGGPGGAGVHTWFDNLQGLVVGGVTPSTNGLLSWYALSTTTTPLAVPGVIFTQTADSTTTANTLTTLLGTGVGTLTLPTNLFVVGRTVRVKVGGYTSVADGGVTAKTLTFSLGGTTVATGSLAASYQSLLNTAWEAEATVTCRTTGAPGTVQATAQFLTMVSGSMIGGFVGSTATTNITTSGTLAVDLKFNNGSATGTLTTTHASVEILN